jgi:putative hemolysin
MANEIQPLRIDVGAVLQSKNSRLAKIVPKFIINLLKRLIHQDEINALLEEAGHLTGRDFVSVALKKLNITYSVKGLENITPGKKYIFASNHPLGGLDGMILIEVLENAAGTLKVLGNDLLCNLKPLKDTFVPVNKHGRQSREIVEQLKEVFTGPFNVLYFPAGLCSRKKRGVICDLPWHKSFVNFAIKYKIDIIPVYFSGRNSGTFYNAANLRTMLGIKFNYEMLLLPHEMFRQKNNNFDIIIGKPVTHEEITSAHNATYWADKIKEVTYKLYAK